MNKTPVCEIRVGRATHRLVPAKSNPISHGCRGCSLNALCHDVVPGYAPRSFCVAFPWDQKRQGSWRKFVRIHDSAHDLVRRVVDATTNPPANVRELFDALGKEAANE